MWQGIAASLPSEVGSLDIRHYCEAGVRYYVDHFEEFLFPFEMQAIGKTPRAMIDQGEWPKVAKGLLSSGLCEVREESQLYHVGEKALYNGLFAVTKDEVVNGVELLRLIMNFKPLNALCRGLEGDTCTLPSVTSLGGLFLDDDEMLCASSEDIRCFFCLFKLPSSWFRFLGFGLELPAELNPFIASGKKAYLVSTVLPMGFCTSVAIAQHIRRNVVRQCLGSMRC